MQSRVLPFDSRTPQPIDRPAPPGSAASLIRDVDGPEPLRMSLADYPVLVRGGGDLATGVIHRLCQVGFSVGVLELAQPLTVRRRVALSSAIYDGTITVEGLTAQRVDNSEQWQRAVAAGIVPVAASPTIPAWIPTPEVVIDARLAKRNIDTRRDDAELVISLGPGFEAGHDCDLVIETNRGGRLGRVIEQGAAEADTGTPGLVAGHGSERVLRAPQAGPIEWRVQIGDAVATGDVLGRSGGEEIVAPFPGVIRGLLHPSCDARSGMKVGDIDPRLDTPCDEMSDKALAIGGAVTVATLDWFRRRASM